MNNKSNKIKVRIAPSPTGYLHLGTARTALFNWLFAKKHGGKFVLRIEDTDLERSSPEYEKDILGSLKWLGLNWDEGPIRQSERIEVYKKYTRKLLDEDKAFWCFHSIEELEKEKSEQVKKKEAPRHICEYKDDTSRHSERNEESNKKGIIRLAVDQNSTRAIHFDDIIRGTIEFNERNLGDFSIAKDLDTPLYNFAVVIDDFETEISHVIRGEDHISNTPKQILIQEALNLPRPQYAHLPLILGQDKSKLSKRHGAISVIEYKKDYLPEAIVNFMGFLGFTYSKEIISIEEMVEKFKLEKVHKSAAIFNIDKLNWINSQYIKKLNVEALKGISGRELPEKSIPLITERLEKLSDVNNFNYFWEEPKYDKNLLIWKKAEASEVKGWLVKAKDVLSSKIEWEIYDKDYLRNELDSLNLEDRGAVYWPLRVALTGKEKSPDPIDIMEVLGREATLRRVDTAINKL